MISEVSVVKVKKYDLSGKLHGEVDIDSTMAKGANIQMIKDYIVAIRRNLRQWSANTKGRSEVNHSGLKPHRQKGTGNARQGCLAAPQYKGGGRAFGPKPKFDQFVRINRKERRAVVRQILLEKIEKGDLVLLQETLPAQPKTKVIADFLKAIGSDGKRVLFLGASPKTEDEGQMAKTPAEHYEVFTKSMRNIPRSYFQLFVNASGHDLMAPYRIVLFDTAVDELKQIFQS